MLSMIIPLRIMPLSSLHQTPYFLLNSTHSESKFYIGYWPRLAHHFSFIDPSLSATSLDCREMLFIILKSHLIRALITHE